MDEIKWEVTATLGYAGSWGAIIVMENERGRWQNLLLRTAHDPRKVFLSDGVSVVPHDHALSMEWRKLTLAMEAVEIQAAERELVGAWETISILTCFRLEGDRCWMSLAGLVPGSSNWWVSHIWNLDYLTQGDVVRMRQSIVERVLSRHDHHVAPERFTSWQGALKYAEDWRPPELETLCPCVEGQL